MLFEYKIEESDEPLSEDDLNDLGRQEWELIQVIKQGCFWTYYFKHSLD